MLHVENVDKEKIIEARRRLLFDRLGTGPSEVAEYWAEFGIEFRDRVFDRILDFLWPYGQDAFTSTILPRSLAMPGLDISEEEDELVVTMDLPNFPKENIRARISNDTLYVSAVREILSKRTGTKRVYWASRPKTFRRTLRLPVPVKENAKVSAKYENGSLTVRIPTAPSGKIIIE